MSNPFDHSKLQPGEESDQTDVRCDCGHKVNEHFIAVIAGSIRKGCDHCSHCQLSPNEVLLTHQLNEAREALKDSIPLRWVDGVPNRIYGGEWFIAMLDNGEKVVLRQLPEEFTYDYRTTDDTYYMAFRIKSWMQMPDSNFIPFHNSDSIPRKELVTLLEPVVKNLNKIRWTNTMEEINRIRDGVITILTNLLKENK